MGINGVVTTRSTTSRRSGGASLLYFLALASFACGKGGGADAGADGASSASSAASLSSVAIPVPAMGPDTRTLPKGPALAAIALDVAIYEKPSKTSKKIGVLRLGAVVGRDDGQAGTEGCPGGWYKIAPRGYVCTAADEATTDVNHPLARAASVRPDTTKPLPYAYGFVRAVAPQYLRVPTREDQLKSEFKLEDHLNKFKEHGSEWQKVTLGANDVELPGKPAPAKKSTDLALGQLFGAQGDFDPIPFWLQNGRAVPNVSSFKVPPASVFANRVRRHTGLAFLGAFKASPEAFGRPFAITTDLRLIPTTKVKPDTGSPWHGVEVDDKLPVPFAFVRKKCEKDKDACPATYRIEGDEAHKVKSLPFRSTVKLTGKGKSVGKTRYREIEGGLWVKASDTGSVFEPSEWPKAAAAGEKWIEVSIDNQTLTLWEGKKAVYATLVSTGQDGLGDPKTTKSTIQGTFRIKNKFVTATMDSNEKGGGTEPSGPEKDKGDKSEKKDKGEEGKTIRRGQGSFELRDVPYVQYFEGAFALHVAYWHDVFGTARSHGCVNLAPIDGQRIFSWTDPPMPDSWHGLYVGDPNQGTTVVVHP